MQHDVEARRLSVIAGGNSQKQRLNGSIERRIEAERDLAFLRRPWRLSVLQLLRALDAAIEHLERERHVFLHRDVLRKLEKPVAGLGVNLDVGDEIDFSPLRFQLAHQRIEHVELRLQRLTILRGHLVARRRLPPAARCRLLSHQRDHRQRDPRDERKNPRAHHYLSADLSYTARQALDVR